MFSFGISKCFVVFGIWELLNVLELGNGVLVLDFLDFLYRLELLDVFDVLDVFDLLELGDCEG